MEQEAVGVLARKAQGGDAAAFDALVERFQDMAVAISLGWLGDIESAKDAAQEAFLIAFTRLDQLREPEAFAGWFVRIVKSQCTRITRTRRLHTIPIEGNPILPSAEPGPEDLTVSKLEYLEVRSLLEGLPAPERLVLSLQHLGGFSQSEISDFLEVPVTTIKKRAHSGRERIKKGIPKMIQRTLGAVRPSQDGDFSDTIRFFIAIRSGDIKAARELISRRPALIQAHEHWDDEEARRAGHQPSRGATASVRAAGQGRTEIVEMLVESGAEVNESCQCAGAESPLWAAVSSGHLDTASVLLRLGADPNQPAFRKMTSLHVAAMRGRRDLAELLISQGATTDVVDAEGRSPLDWALLKGHSEVAELLGSTLSSEISKATSHGNDDRIVTGIKAMDLYLPLRKGDLVDFVGAPGSGQLLLAAEISHNLADALGVETIWLGFEMDFVDAQQIQNLVDEAQPNAKVTSYLVPRHLPIDERSHRFHDSIQGVMPRVREGGGVIFLVTDRGQGADIDSVLPELARATVAFVLSAPYGPTPKAQGPHSALLKMDERLSQQHLYPAISPVSASIHPDPQVQIAERVRELVEAYLAGQEEKLTPVDLGRAQRLVSFLTQPFHVAEPFGGRPGVTVPVEDTLAGVEAILSGQYDSIDPDQLAYIGAISNIPL